MPHRIRVVGTLVLVLGCTPPHPSVDPEPIAGPSECAGIDAVAKLWTSSRRTSIQSALQTQPGEWSGQLFADLDARLPQQREAWTGSYARACAAEAGPRMRCLEAQAGALDGLLALIEADPERAAKLWVGLERTDLDPRSCPDRGGGPDVVTSPANTAALASLPWLAQLGEFAELEARLTALEADPALTSTNAHAWQLGYARAELALAAGQLDVAEAARAEADTPLRSLASSVAVTDPLTAHLVLLGLRATLAEAGSDVEAAELAHHEAIALARDLGGRWLLVDRLAALGRARLERGDAVGAVEPLVEAIGLASRLGGPDDPQTAALQRDLARAQIALGRIDAAADALTQARDAFVIALGPDHPETLATVEAAGQLFVTAGRPGDAQLAFLDLLEIYTDLYGVKDWHTALVKLELADTLIALDQHASAQILYTEALVPLGQEFGVVDPRVVRASIHLGIAELALGNLEAAQLHCGRGRDLAHALPSDSPLAGEAQQCLAEVGRREPAKSKPKSK